MLLKERLTHTHAHTRARAHAQLTAYTTLRYKYGQPVKPTTFYTKSNQRYVVFSFIYIYIHEVCFEMAKIWKRCIINVEQLSRKVLFLNDIL